MKKEWMITFKGISYILDEDYWAQDCVNNSLDFQHSQLQFCIDTGDYSTLENRIDNMLIWGGIKNSNSKTKKNEL